MLTEEEKREHVKHNNAVLAARAVLARPEGKALFKFLFESFEVGKLPDFSFEGDLLHDKLGSLRAGQAVFELASEAEADVAALLLAQIERERYALLRAEFESQIGGD